MAKPTSHETEVAQSYRTTILGMLEIEIAWRVRHGPGDGWLTQAVESVRKQAGIGHHISSDLVSVAKAAGIDPDITDAMVDEALWNVISELRELIAFNNRQNAGYREANEWIELALREPRSVDVIVSPEIASLLESGPAVPSETASGEYLLRFKAKPAKG